MFLEMKSIKKYWGGANGPNKYRISSKRNGVFLRKADWHELVNNI